MTYRLNARWSLKGNKAAHPSLRQMPEQIFNLGLSALSEMNYKCTFGSGPGADLDHYDYYCAIHAMHAAELLLKAIIALEHPLLIFSNTEKISNPNDGTNDLSIERLLEKGITHDASKIPTILWAACDKTFDITNFEKIRKYRNKIQHFSVPDNEKNVKGDCLRLLHEDIGRILKDTIGINTIYYIPDEDQWDYFFAALIRYEIKFVMDSNISVSEINIEEELSNTDSEYQSWFHNAAKDIGGIEKLQWRYDDD